MLDSGYVVHGASSMRVRPPKPCPSSVEGFMKSSILDDENLEIKMINLSHPRHQKSELCWNIRQCSTRRDLRLSRLCPPQPEG